MFPEDEVTKALQTNKYYLWRTLQGLCRETELDAQDVSRGLQTLNQKGLVIRTHQDFQTIYAWRDRYLARRTWKELLRDVCANRLGGR